MAQPAFGPLSRCGLSLGLLYGLMLPALAQMTGPEVHTGAFTAFDASALLDFDIPAQPLMTALDQYASTTHLPILAPSEIVHDRMSPAVHGRLLPDAALRRLLAGTGLMAERQGKGTDAAYYLKEQNPQAASQTGRAALFGQPGFAALASAK